MTMIYPGQYLKTISLILITALVVTMYWHVFVDLFNIWSNREEYNHGFMIPFVSLYFIWQKKDLILSKQSSSLLLGFSIVFLALLFYFIGIVGDLFAVLRFSFIFLLFGLSLLLVGYQSTKLMAVPILILIFSFPLPPVIQAQLTVKLQLLSSQIGVSVIRACDIPVYLEGNVIDLGNYKLQVVEACSGLRYLFPLIGLAFICVYLYQVTFWKKALVFLSAIPVTLLMNSFRIGVTGILVNAWGIEAAEGFTHDFEGWIIFIACLGILLLEMWLLAWQERKTKIWQDIFGLPDSTTQSVETEFTLPLIPSYTMIALLVAAVFLIQPLGKRADFIPERTDFLYFPLQIADWQGKKDTLDLETVKFLELTDYILISYRNPISQEINFYAAYYQSQKHGIVPHSPKQCIPGGGWEVKEVTTDVYQNITFNRVLIQKEQHKQLVYYWYKKGKKNIANEYRLKWHTVLDSLENRRTDVALIRLTTALSEQETFEQADARLKQFMLQIHQKLPVYIPD